MDDVVRTDDRLCGFDFAAHNAEVARCWEAYNAGKPYRVPIIMGVGSRYFMARPDTGGLALGFRRFTEDPDAMYDALLAFQRWSRCNVLQDAELGAPERWSIAPDFQNYYEAAWFGCPVEFFADQVPDTRPVFADQPERLLDGGPPDPVGGFMAHAAEYREHFQARASADGYLGRPVDVAPLWCGMGTDGPMTVACNLFGPQFVCTAMAAEPERLHGLLEFITDATIRRMTVWRQRFDVPVPQDGFGCADDSIALISTAMYREHILPYHRRIYDAFATPGPRGIHLCGDSTRHFVTLRDELNIRSFDTGFPVDFGRQRRELGPDIGINGGPHVELLRSAAPEQVVAETTRVLESGILEGGRFVLREGNNMAPGTPLENMEAMYRTGRALGVLRPAPEEAPV